MQATTLEELFSSPSFIFVSLAILAIVANIIIGVNILPQDKSERGYKLHRYVFWTVPICYSMFLVYNHYLQGNTYFEYFVFLYFLTVVPWSGKINITLHAIITSLGLVLLATVVVFSLI